jgi:large subunit ribosomal protein L15
MGLANLTVPTGSRKAAKRVGRGTGNGHGKTSCRGNNGYGSRRGSRRKPGFEGGQMPLQRRLPKRGFHNPFQRAMEEVNLGAINGRLPAIPKDVVDAAFLAKAGLLDSDKGPFKVLGDGEFTKAATIKANAFSQSALAKIEKAGGKAEKC